MLQDGSPHLFSTPDKEVSPLLTTGFSIFSNVLVSVDTLTLTHIQALSGTIAFKDSNIYDNSPKGLSCCYFHDNTASQRCLSDYELL